MALQGQVTRAQEIVPELVGVSLSSTTEGVTFTFVASNDVVVTLDALQYLDGGPCGEAIHMAEFVHVPDADALDERQWELFSRGESAAGVESTLSMPVVTAGRVTGGVNLHASRAGAFRGRYDQLADVFGAWSAGAVTTLPRPSARWPPGRASARARPELAWNTPAPWPASRPRTWLERF